MAQDSFSYDVFISYRWVEPDRAWVRQQLAPALEASGLRVALDVNDFHAGRHELLEMERVHRESRVLLAVLTPAYFDGNRMVGFEALMARRRDPQGLHSSLIPLVLSPCQCPEWLGGLIPIDWTVSDDRPQEWAKLLRELKAPNEVPPPPGLPSGGIPAGYPSSIFHGVFQAPRPPEPFVGRHAELAFLQGLITQPQTVTAIRAGTGGEGKSALAAVAASKVRQFFADGILWARVDEQPLADIVESFVSALEPHAADRLLADKSVEARARTFRAIAARKNCLIVLDNVEDEQAIEALIPSSGASAVLLTTRRALRAVPPARVLNLGALDKEAFSLLFGEVVGRAFSVAEARTLERLREVLGGLPLAARIAASIVRELGWSLNDYLTRFIESTSLDWLGIEGSEAVRRSFSISLENLPNATTRECFAVLGLLGRLPIDHEIIAAATNRPAVEVQQAVITLAMRGLVETKGKVTTVHPLMKRYASELASSTSDLGAVERLATYCRRRLSQWNARQNRFEHGGIGKSDDAIWGMAAAEYNLQARDDTAAQEVIVAIADILTLQGQERALVSFIDSIAEANSLSPWLMLYRAGFIANGRDTERAAPEGIATLNELCGDQDAKIASAAFLILAKLSIRALKFSTAEAQLQAGEALKRQCSPPDLKGIAFIKNELARIAAKDRGDYRVAAALHNDAYELQRDLQDKKGMAYSLWRRGSIELWHLNDLDAAAATLGEAERLSIEACSKLTQGEIMLQLAEVLQRRERYITARDLLSRCAALSDECDYPLLQAKVQKNLGSLYATVEQYGCALQSLHRSQVIFQRIADDVESKKVTKFVERVSSRITSLSEERTAIGTSLNAPNIDPREGKRLRKRVRRLDEMLSEVPGPITLGKP